MKIFNPLQIYLSKCSTCWSDGIHLLSICDYCWLFVYIYSLSVNVCLYSLCYRWMLAYIYSLLVNVCFHLLITCECLFTFTHYLWMFITFTHCVYIYSLLVNVCLHLLITCKCLFTFTHYLWMFITFIHYLWKFVYIYSLLVNVHYRNYWCIMHRILPRFFIL